MAERALFGGVSHGLSEEELHEVAANFAAL